MEYTSAGCIFTNGSHLLGGYQPNKAMPCISGIGGKREGCEEFIETAIREMLEELFGIYNSDLIKPISVIAYERLIISGDYVSIVYSFVGLEKILNELHRLEVVTPLYTTVPRTVNDLIFKRLPVNSEISHLCLLPVVAHARGTPFIERCFFKDIQMLLK